MWTLWTKDNGKGKYSGRNCSYPKTNAPPNQILRKRKCVRKTIFIQRMLSATVHISYQPDISLTGIPINRAPISPRHVAIWMNAP